MKVVLAAPAYGPVEPEARDALINAVVFAAKHGTEWAGTASTNREGWESARNRPTKEILAEGGVDGIMWVDSDMLVPQDGFARLLDPNLDLISGLYFQRLPPYWPNLYTWNGSSRMFRRLRQYPESTLTPIGGFGFGICFTSVKVLRAVGPDPFKFGKYSEDLSFCHRATLAGFQPYADTGVIARHHQGPRWIGERDFRRWMATMSDFDAPGPERVRQ